MLLAVAVISATSYILNQTLTYRVRMKTSNPDKRLAAKKTITEKNTYM